MSTTTRRRKRIIITDDEIVDDEMRNFVNKEKDDDDDEEISSSCSDRSWPTDTEIDDALSPRPTKRTKHQFLEHKPFCLQVSQDDKVIIQEHQEFLESVAPANVVSPPPLLPTIRVPNSNLSLPSSSSSSSSVIDAAEQHPHLSTPDEALQLFKMCPKYADLQTVIATTRKMPLYGLIPWVVVPYGNPVTAIGDARHGLMQPIAIYASEAEFNSGTEPSSCFWLHAEDIDEWSLRWWLKKRYLTYHLTKLTGISGGQVSLEIEAAVLPGLKVTSVDTETNWLRELGGTNSPLGRTLAALVHEYKQLSGPIAVPESLGGHRCRRSRKIHDPTTSPILAPCMRLMIVPGVRGCDGVRNLFRAMLTLKSGPQANSLFDVDSDCDAITPPPVNERDHLIPLGLAPSAEQSAHLRLLTIVTHCDQDGRVWVELPIVSRRPATADADGDHSMTPEKDTPPNRFWYPDVQRPTFVDVMAALLCHVFDCLVVIVACGGWSLHAQMQRSLEDLAVQHRLILVLPRRIDVHYLEASDPTLVNLARFVAAALPEVAALQSQSSMSRPLDDTVSRLRSIAHRAADSTLLDSSACMSPIIIDHERHMTEVRLNSASSSSAPPTTVPLVEARGTIDQPLLPQTNPMLYRVASPFVGQNSNALQWLLVEHVGHDDATSTTSVNVVASTAPLIRTATKFYVLVLRGRGLDAARFKNEVHKLKACHRNKHTSRPSFNIGTDAVRRMVADAARTNSPQSLWLPARGQCAHTLYPVTGSSDPFIQCVMSYHEQVTLKFP